MTTVRFGLRYINSAGTMHTSDTIADHHYPPAVLKGYPASPARFVCPSQLARLLQAKTAAGGRHAWWLKLGRIDRREGVIMVVLAEIGQILETNGVVSEIKELIAHGYLTENNCKRLKNKEKKLVGPGGLEPPTNGL